MERTNIKDVTTSIYNPIKNSICERMHHSMGNILRTLLHGHQSPENLTQVHNLIDEALAICQHALWSSAHTTLGATPELWYSIKTCF